MTAKNWVQFRVRDLIAAMLVICLALAWWVEHSRREELVRSLAQFGSLPWIQIYEPSGREKWGAGAASMGVDGQAFFPSHIPRSTEITFELLMGTHTVFSSTCETRRVDSRNLDFVGNARMTNTQPGFYFLKIQIIDAETKSVLATQGQVIEFIDTRAQEETPAVRNPAAGNQANG